ncbi:MAG: sigma-54-dependent Fis family transcriptional regulator, partial [Betaproteobacteria bacterium]|nr:sigma-54-dependent Fis family transcriptional regulator [Betaproteobacteria bacterium]
LIESEFFGHERGAFTGATERREGRFELAHNGTLLLDEVSEIPPALQAKLLRVLQEREFERVGGSRTIKVDVRIIATSNRDLLGHVAKGEFRQDLYYRLNVFPVHVPALRERVDDIPVLADHFLQRFTRKHGVKVTGFSDSACATMLAYKWPGNVRELQNTVERAVILSEDGRPVTAAALGLPMDLVQTEANQAHPWAAGREAEMPPVPAAAGGDQGNAVTGGDGQVLPLDQLEKQAIRAALRQTAGNRTQAALGSNGTGPKPDVRISNGQPVAAVVKLEQNRVVNEHTGMVAQGHVFALANLATRELARTQNLHQAMGIRPVNLHLPLDRHVPLRNAMDEAPILGLGLAKAGRHEHVVVGGEGHHALGQ